jgi:hypothetical protein
MKFKKFGKALLMSALCAGVVLGVSSCVQSYTVGYLYVTGTTTSESDGNGYVAGFKIDHNTGKLTAINGLNPPASSGGANPVRALLLPGGRFLYVLNQGVSTNPAGTSICTTEYPCQNPNITQFAVGANGVLTPQETFETQGKNPFRMVTDSSGTHIMVLDHDSPDNYLPAGTSANANGCAQALNGAQTCGDITVFSVNSSTGRLSLVQNSQVQVTNANGTQHLTYFPVPVNPIDFALAGGNLLTLNGTPASGDSVFPYSYNSTTGQLTVTINSSDSIGSVYNATAIVSAGNYVWVLDNDPISVTIHGTTTTSQSQILPESVSSTGSLSGTSSGAIADDENQSNPVFLVVESKGTRFYVANQGNPSDKTIPLSGVAGYLMNTPFLPSEISPSLSFGSGAFPVCLVEDPSDQFFYTANFDSQTVTGQVLDQVSGALTPLNQSSKVSSNYALTGPPTWCLVAGRT